LGFDVTILFEIAHHFYLGFSNSQFGVVNASIFPQLLEPHHVSLTKRLT